MFKFTTRLIFIFCLVFIISIFPIGVASADDDDGVNEVAGYGVYEYNFAGDLPNSVNNVAGFMGVMDDYYTVRFNKTDDDVVQSDFESNSGCDTADICYYSGHGEGGRLIFQNDFWPFWTDRTYWDEAHWGDVDLEWIMLRACYTLENDTTLIKSTSEFANALNGARLICGAATTLSDTLDGANVANRLVDSDGGGADIAQKVKSSWFYGCDQNQPSGKVLRVIGEGYFYGDDYIWGQGTGPYDYTYSVDNYYYEWSYT